MATNEKEVPVFLKPIADADPELYSVVADTLGLVHGDGALELKYKLMLSMVADAIRNHPGGALACAREARAAGATSTQLAEAMRVVFAAGGLPMSLENIDIYREILEG